MRRVFYRHSDGRVEERVDLPHLDELRENPSACLWVDLEGEAPESLEELGRQFALHPVTIDRKSTRLNSIHSDRSRMPSSA